MGAGGHFEELKDSMNIAVKASMYYWEIKKLNGYTDCRMDSTAIDEVGAIINGSGEAKPNDWDKRRNWTLKINDKLK